MFSINISKFLLICSPNICIYQHVTPPAGEEDTPVCHLPPLYYAQQWQTHQFDDAGSLCLLEHFHP